jgi:hypothetical protein
MITCGVWGRKGLLGLTVIKVAQEEKQESLFLRGISFKIKKKVI